MPICSASRADLRAAPATSTFASTKTHILTYPAIATEMAPTPCYRCV